MTDEEQKLEYRTVSFLVSTLASICAAPPNQIIDWLTGLLWDKQEADQIKVANTPAPLKGDERIVCKTAQFWRDDAFEAAAQIAERYGSGPECLRDIRALKAEPPTQESLSSVPEKRVLFRSLPLGARFQYIGGADTWVALERHGRGLIAKWGGNVLDFTGQSIACAEVTEEAAANLMVLLLPDKTD